MQNRWFMSLSARRAWIEIVPLSLVVFSIVVALRKESVDRNSVIIHIMQNRWVALRKESVDRNSNRYTI